MYKVHVEAQFDRKRLRNCLRKRLLCKFSFITLSAN
jgi:hypothetical protein